MTQYARKGRSFFKPGRWPAVGGMTVSNPFLKRQDIGDWTRAVNQARSALFPRRKLLHDLYDNIVLDGHVQSVLLARTAQVANRQIRWFTNGRPEPEGKEDVYKTVISTPWFHRFIEGAMSVPPYGTTVLELVPKNGEVHDVAVVPRANVAPEHGLILEDPNQYEKGIRYREDAYWSRYLIEVGEPRNYGGLMVAAMYVIYKRGGFGNWAQYMELFGMPLRKGRYNPYDDASRRKLTEALEQMGSASWVVIPDGSDIEFIAAPNSSGTGSAELYDKNIERCNAEISKLFLGQTLTTESGSRGARALGEVHQETKNDIAEMDMRRLEFLMNYELRPRLVALGYPLENGEFHFYEEASIPAKDRIVVDMQVAKHVPIPDSYWYKTYGIPAPTTAELKAIQERKRASVPAALREHQEQKARKEEEGDGETDEADRAFEASLGAELDAYYGLPPSYTAAAGGPKGKGAPQYILDRIALGVAKGEITGDSVDPELMQWLAKELTKAIMGSGEIGQDNAPPALTPKEQRQIQVFSGFKTNAQLRKATEALYDTEGAMVPWATFKKRILQIDQAYNVRYLQAEYNLATASRAGALAWKDMQAMKDVAPFGKYSTVGDDRVREAHAAMDGVIKHLDDPFWDVWWPPNGWNCRCIVVPMRSDKGGKPVPPGIVPPKTLFANNVGKSGVIFPKGHPYEQQASKKVRAEVGKLAEAAMLNFTNKVSKRASKVDKDLAEDAATAFGALDLVHAVRGMPFFGMVAYPMDALGTYHPQSRLMRINPNGPHKALTILHETGHHLDRYVLGPGYEYGTRYAIKGKLKTLLDAIRASHSFQELKAIADVGEYVDEYGETIPLLPKAKRAIKIMLEPEELFARAYAQYIALRSNNETLNAQVAAIREWQGPNQHRQWSGTDFEPIAKAFDELFKGKRWKPLK